MRHRSTPVSTCQRYALAVHRVNSANALSGPRRHLSRRRRTQVRAPPRPQQDQCRVFGSDTPQPVGITPCSLWTTVDPQARKLLASGFPGIPHHRLAAQANHRDAQRSRGVRRDKCGHNGPNR